MANNKVQLADGTTLIDLTEDTVTADDMLAGVTAHAASGEQITGTLAAMTVYRVSNGKTLTFHMPMASIGFFLVNHTQIFLIWNNASGVTMRGINIPAYSAEASITLANPSGYTLERDSSDLTQITYTRSTNATLEAVVPIM